MLHSRVISKVSFTFVSVREFISIVISSELYIHTHTYLGVSIYGNDALCEL